VTAHPGAANIRQGGPGADYPGRFQPRLFTADALLDAVSGLVPWPRTDALAFWTAFSPGTDRDSSHCVHSSGARCRSVWPEPLGRVKRCRRKFSHKMAAMGKPPAEIAVAAECRRFHPDVTNVPPALVVNQESIEHPASLRRESLLFDCGGNGAAIRAPAEDSSYPLAPTERRC